MPKQRREARAVIHKVVSGDLREDASEDVGAETVVPLNVVLSSA